MPFLAVTSKHTKSLKHKQSGNQKLCFLWHNSVNNLKRNHTMQISFGAYEIRSHELDQKLSIQITSKLGEVHLNSDDNRSSDFPNEVCFTIEKPSDTIKATGLKRFSFGPYKFILGINYSGELFLFHSAKFIIGKKVIDGKDSLTLALLKDPKTS